MSPICSATSQAWSSFVVRASWNPSHHHICGPMDEKTLQLFRRRPHTGLGKISEISFGQLSKPHQDECHGCPYYNTGILLPWRHMAWLLLSRISTSSSLLFFLSSSSFSSFCFLLFSFYFFFFYFITINRVCRTANHYTQFRMS